MKLKSIFPIPGLIILISLISCSSPSANLPATTTLTPIPPTETVLPSATPMPPTETPTSLPPTPTITPINPIQHFPAGQAFTVTSIHMIDANLGWAIGGLPDPGDHVLTTSDGGLTWKDVTPPEDIAPADDHKTATGYFQDANIGWVIYSYTSGITPSQSVVWRTQDAGTTWKVSQPLDITNLSEFYNPSELQFVDGNTGWLMVHVGVGMNHDYIVLYRSNNGGVTWERLLDPYTDGSGIMSCSKTGLLFTDNTQGWLTGDCHGVAAGVQLFKSSDGGSTWAPVTLPDPSNAPGLFSNFEAACGSYDPFFFSNELGHLAVNCMDYSQDPPTYQYYIFTTYNGGSDWVSSTYPGEALYFFSEGTGWALARKIHRTTDGGFTWKAIANVNWDVEVDFVSEYLGWGVARETNELALVKTVDGGAKWTMLEPRVGK